MEEFKTSLKLGIGNDGVLAKFRHLGSGMEEFEPNSRLGFGNGGVRAKFEAWNLEWKSSN